MSVPQVLEKKKEKRKNGPPEKNHNLYSIRMKREMKIIKAIAEYSD